MTFSASPSTKTDERKTVRRTCQALAVFASMIAALIIYTDLADSGRAVLDSQLQLSQDQDLGKLEELNWTTAEVSQAVVVPAQSSKTTISPSFGIILVAIAGVYLFAMSFYLCKSDRCLHYVSNSDEASHSNWSDSES